MAKLTKLPSLAIIGGFKGTIDYYVYMGIPCARAWPRPPAAPRAPAVQAQWAAWSYISKQWNNLTPFIREAYRLNTAGTNLTGRDLFIKNYIHHQFLDLSASPSIPASPQADKFFAKDISIGSFTNGVCIKLITDVPCHLYMYFTHNPPQIHPLTRTVRGLQVPWFTRWCFTGYQGLEQLETGDTLEHTFLLCSIGICKHVWFSFRGTTGGELSPSTTAIFTYHHKGETPLFNLSFEDWGDPPVNPFFWTRFTFGTGWSRWYRESIDVYMGKYAVKLEAGGYARGTGYRQLQSAIPYRGQELTFYAMGKGLNYANNDLTVYVDGTGGWLRHDQLDGTGDWEIKHITGRIPWDATQMRIDVRCYSPQYGPVFGKWDDISIEC